MRINYDKLYTFDKIKHPTAIDTLQYIQNLAYITSNYCDSTTVAYHKDIAERIYNVYPYIRHNFSPLDDFNGELIVGLINIFTAEDEQLSKEQNYLIKLHEVAFDFNNKLYQYMDDGEKSVCISMVTVPYLNENIRHEIVNIWIKHIQSIRISTEYSSCAKLLHDLSLSLSSNGEHKTALRIESALQEKCEVLFGYSSEELLDCLYFSSVAYFNSNDYGTALNLTERIIKAKMKQNISDKDMVLFLRNMRHCLFTMGRYKDATSYARRVLDTYDAKNSIEYLNDYSALAYCIFYSGEEVEAITMLIANLKQEELINSPNLCNSYCSLSTLLRLNDDMVNSIKYAELSLSLCNTESQEYDDQITQYTSLINLGAAYYKLNDIQSSTAVLMRAALMHKQLKELRRFDKERTEADVILWSVLARDYIISNRPADAEISLNEALKIAKDYYGEYNERYLKIYSILADLQAIKNDRLGALHTYENILKHVEPGSHAYYSYLSGYSDFCVGLERYEEAMDAITKAFSKTNSTTDLIKLSRLEYRLGQYDSMRQHLHTIFEQNRNLVNKSFLTYNNIQRKAFWWGPYVGGWFRDDLPALILSSNSTDSLSVRTLYDATIFNKGILLSTESNIRDLILNSNNATLICKYNRFLKLEKVNNNSGEFRDYSLFAEEAKLESELMQYVRQHSSSISALNVSSKDIQNKLSSNSLAIEFISAQIDTTKTRHYYALVLEPNETSEPKLAYLFNSNQFDMINPETYYTTEALSGLIWKPLSDYIQRYDTIYFAPCDLLNSIAIEYLPHLEGNGYMSDYYKMYRLSNTRKLLTPHSPIGQTTIGLFGGMIYNADLNNVDAYNNYPQELIEGVDVSRVEHKYLPNSKIEVEKVDSIVKIHKIPSYLVTGLDGTEGFFRNICLQKSPRIVHLATHGIFYSNEDIEDDPEYSQLPFIKRSSHKNIYTEDLALTQSVLLFTGSDTSYNKEEKQPSHNDGILTAQEVAALNLENTDLVVLSACQSGLGEIKADGVFGLQRGFKKAGVKSLLMSLWDVDDYATQILMVEFYKNLLSGVSKLEALHRAQKTLRQSHKYNDPYYWAGFILLDALN